MSTLLKVVILGFFLLSTPQFAGAALIAAPSPDFAPAGSHNVDKLSISLTLNINSVAEGETNLTYNLALNEDTGAIWKVIEFAIIRDWSEGAASAPSNNAGWNDPTTTTGHFLNWTGDAVSAIAEGKSASFGYTVAGAAPVSQLFVYYVTKDGGVPFQVIDSAVPTSFQSAVQMVPEPSALALVGGIGLTLLGLRHGVRHR